MNLNWDLLEPEDVNLLGGDVNVALRTGRDNGDDYFDRWFSGEKAAAAKDRWKSIYEFCKANHQVFVPYNL